jgi:pyrimidine operon attenuation protein/uracil phosphoribosyltransferase
MDELSIKRAITRISNEIIERNKGIKDIILVGIKTRGIPLANRISEKIEEIEGEKPPVCILDIQFYRDDLDNINNDPYVVEKINYDINNKIIVLVDDVIYTGRTVRAALDALMDQGRPKKVQLAVLVDRGHRELPIRPDFIGKNVPTASNEIVSVKLKEIDDSDEVIILER